MTFPPLSKSTLLIIKERNDFQEIMTLKILITELINQRIAPHFPGAFTSDEANDKNLNHYFCAMGIRKLASNYNQLRRASGQFV